LPPLRQWAKLNFFESNPILNKPVSPILPQNTSRGGRDLLRHFLRMFSLVASLFHAETILGAEAERARAEKFCGPWQTDQPGFIPDLTYPILYSLSLQSVSIAFLGNLDRDVTGFTGPSARNFEEAFTKGPTPDDDDGFWNYIGHPFAGSESYLRARAQGYGPLGSFLFSGAASVVWEFGFEGWYQRPSTQDLIITPLAGSLLGEVRFRAKRALLETDSATSRVLAVAIDPLQSAAELIGRTFGQDWTEPAFRKDPVLAGRSGPLFTTGLANSGGRPALTFQCRIIF